ncbi:MAG: PEP-CTERM sorting domain-containing protein [Rhodoferax sp.]|nr:PEP-CTERM sorting domain-containing protein [Rhodoferax sp.]
MTPTMRTVATVAALALSSSAAQALLIYDADNEGFTVGNPPPLTGAPDAPTTVDPNLVLTVQDGGTVATPNLGPDRFLRLTETAGEAPDFRYDAGTSYTSGIISMSMDLLFETDDAYHVYFRESLTSAVSVANIMFQAGGTGSVTTTGGNSNFTYVTGLAYQLVAMLNLDTELMDVSLNGTPIASALAIDDVFGAAIIGFEFSGSSPTRADLDGAMQVDNFRMSVNTVPEPGMASLLLLAGAGGLFASAHRRRQRAQQPAARRD